MTTRSTLARTAAVLLTGFAVFLLTPTLSAADVVIAFRMPSGNIGCVYASNAGGREELRCDIRSRLRPRPPRPKNCSLDWGDSFVMGTRGSVETTCHGDTAILPNAKVLAYGRGWTRSGFVCSSRLSGLRCRNRSGHGFLLSRQHSYRF